MQEHHHFNYLIKKVKRLGKGSFGYVDEVELYNAKGIKCSGKYARKTFSPTEEIRQSILDLAQVRERFNEEVKCQADCKSSYVVPIYLHNLFVDSPWFVMDLAEEDLLSLINKNDYDINKKISILRMIISGVDYIHNKNLLHRDIKPQNILMFSDGSFKLSDFGLVKDLNRDNPLTAIADLSMGTEGYKAPEIAAGKYDPRTDIYALGVVIEQFAGEILNGIISKCTMRNPNDRYQSAQSILDDINSIYPEG